MFLAAILDARPDLLSQAQQVASNIGPGVSLSLVKDRRKGISGHRLDLTLPGPERGPRHYPDYVDVMRKAAPNEDIADRACGILRLLAEAEASVHGVTLDRVHFHEISDWDSIADILLAAWAMETLGITSASVGDIPAGGGRVQTEHGPLPVPTPATLLLLKGYALIEDGISGERVTPTGAAILAHLAPTQQGPRRIVTHVGHGLGTRDFPSIANLLRLSLCDLQPIQTGDVVGEISFHVDDQSPEDLAIGLDHIRQATGVLDVIQMPATGKKGRLGTRIEILCRAENLESVADLCFDETTTIGLRHQLVQRRILDRTHHTRKDDRNAKSVTRPGGQVTTKVEADDLKDVSNHHARNDLRGR